MNQPPPVPRAAPIHSPLYVAKDLLETRYQGADCVFVAGSVGRGEASAYSDLDLIVLYPDVSHAYRESFTHKGWPVEASVHDLETLRYFLYKVERPEASASLAEMVKEGFEVPQGTSRSAQAKIMASEVLADGPPTLSEEECDEWRYRLSALIDDIREPRSRHELMAAAALAYGELARFHLRMNLKWVSHGKSLPRRLRLADGAEARRFEEAFDAVFARGEARGVVALAEDLLKPHGGFLFEGHRREAPAGWRSY
jgi:hypothetical protein